MRSTDRPSSCLNELLSWPGTNLVPVSKRIKLWLLTLGVCLAEREVAASLLSAVVTTLREQRPVTQIGSNGSVASY